MSGRPWVDRMRDFCAHMRGFGWRHPILIFGRSGQRAMFVGVASPVQVWRGENNGHANDAH